MENNNEDFDLTFDNEVIDMTDPNRKSAQNIYGTYQTNNYGTDYNTGYNNSYDTGYTNGGYANYTNYASTQENSGLYSILNILYYIALFAPALYIAYFIITQNYDMHLYKRLSQIVGIFVELVFIVDACINYGRYKRNSLLITGIAFPFLYPFFRCGSKSESKKIPALVIVLEIVLIFVFIKDGAVKLALSEKGHDLYASEYDTSMNKFKSHKYDGKTETEDVLRMWFEDYNIDVTKEDSDFLYVKVSGKTNTDFGGAVKTDSTMDPNTSLEFKVDRNTGDYTVETLRLNDRLYNQYRDTLWTYWHSHY